MKIWAAISMLIYIGACSIATSLPLDTVERLDTRDIIGFRFADSSLVSYSVNMINAALPLETALCYTGFIEDTTYYAKEFLNPLDSSEVTRQLVIITGVSPANVSDAGSTYLNYHDDTACANSSDLIATGHSHPGVSLFQSCDHSDVDAVFNHKKQTKYVMSFVWCTYGIGILWADGRRWQQSILTKRK